jgi:CheY-like chemotaxis protein
VRCVCQPRAVELVQVVRDTEKMLRRLLGDDIELVLHLASSGGRVYADPNQIEQVIVNLAVNARDAMPGGGKLTIEVADVELDATSAVGDLAPGPWVTLVVTDTGVGMDAATRERIFEPFFTTKEKGKGTGLGLSTVFGIVTQSGGHIDVQSQPGRGCAFTLYLPGTTRAVEVASAAPPEPPSLHGSETVLLVEDDEQVREVSRTILRRGGYHVIDARNAGEAFLASETYADTIHLLLTDVMMARMTGRELAERLAASRPQMKVLYISGHAEDLIVHHGMLDPGIAFLQKPITPDILLRKVREVLVGAPS